MKLDNFTICALVGGVIFVAFILYTVFNGNAPITSSPTVSTDVTPTPKADDKPFLMKVMSDVAPKPNTHAVVENNTIPEVVETPTEAQTVIPEHHSSSGSSEIINSNSATTEETQAPQTKHVNLTVSVVNISGTTKQNVTTAGDVVNYQAIVTNTGTAALWNMNVTGSLCNFKSDNFTALAPGKSCIYEGNYTVSISDLSQNTVLDNFVIISIEGKNYTYADCEVPILCTYSLVTTDLKGADGHVITELRNNKAVSTPCSQIYSFIMSDTTDLVAWNNTNFTDTDYAEQVQHNAEINGIACSIDNVIFQNGSLAINVFNTSDYGQLRIDCTQNNPVTNLRTGDKCAYVAPGSQYGVYPINTMNFNIDFTINNCTVQKEIVY